MKPNGKYPLPPSIVGSVSVREEFAVIYPSGTVYETKDLSFATLLMHGIFAQTGKKVAIMRRTVKTETSNWERFIPAKEDSNGRAQ